MNTKKEILKHLIYNRQKKYTPMDVFDWAKREFDTPVSLEEIIKVLHELTELGFLKDHRAKKTPPRYQAEAGYVRNLIEKLEI